MRPVILVDIKEFELPKVYADTIEDKLSQIPRITIIEITNIGRSIGGILSLDFKTNNNTTLQGVSIESRSNVLRYTSEEAKDGSSVIKLDMEYIRPKEKVIVKALTDIKANFILSKTLIMSGQILEQQDYDRRNKIVWSLFLVGFLINIGLFAIAIDAVFGGRLVRTFGGSPKDTR